VAEETSPRTPHIAAGLTRAVTDVRTIGSAEPVNRMDPRALVTRPPYTANVVTGEIPSSLWQRIRQAGLANLVQQYAHLYQGTRMDPTAGDVAVSEGALVYMVQCQKAKVVRELLLKYKRIVLSFPLNGRVLNEPITPSKL
jgi:hypothetical protein